MCGTCTQVTVNFLLTKFLILFTIEYKNILIATILNNRNTFIQGTFHYSPIAQELIGMDDIPEFTPHTIGIPKVQRPGHRWEHLNADLYFTSGPRVIREAMRRCHGRAW